MPAIAVKARPSLTYMLNFFVLFFGPSSFAWAFFPPKFSSYHYRRGLKTPCACSLETSKYDQLESQTLYVIQCSMIERVGQFGFERGFGN